MELSDEQIKVIRASTKDEAAFRQVLRVLQAGQETVQPIAGEGGKRYALAVDDNEHVGMLVKVSMESEGFEVTTATSGQDALEYLKTQKYDIVFLDIILPDIDGGEIFARMREAAEFALNKSTPVIFITGLLKPEDEQRLAPRDEVYIGKPFTADKLRLTARKVLEAQEQS